MARTEYIHLGKVLLNNYSIVKHVPSDKYLCMVLFLANDRFSTHTHSYHFNHNSPHKNSFFFAIVAFVLLLLTSVTNVLCQDNGRNISEICTSKQVSLYFITLIYSVFHKIMLRLT